MKNTLNQILSVVSSIERNQSYALQNQNTNPGDSGAPPKQPANGSTPTDTTNISTLAKDISMLSVGISSLATNTLKLSLAPNKSSVITFINDLVKVANKGKSDNISASTKALSAVSNFLPALSKNAFKVAIYHRMGVFKNSAEGIKQLLSAFGTKSKNPDYVKNIEGQSRVLLSITRFMNGCSTDIKKFAKLQSSGLIKSAVNGISAFVTGISKMTSKLSDDSISKLQNVSESLSSISSSIRNGLIGLATGIVVFSGLMVLASMGIGHITGTGAVGGGFIIFGVIAASLLTMGVMFSTLGLFEDKIKKGTESLSGMGDALLGVAKGFLAFAVVYAASAAILGVSVGQTCMIIAASVLVSSAVFMLIGVFDEKIKAGVEATQGMGKSLLWLAGSTLAYFAAYKLITMMGLGDGTSIMAVTGLMAISILVPAMAFGLLGSFSQKISDGAKSIMMMGASILVFSVCMLGTAYVFKKINETLTAPDGIGYLGLIGGLGAITIGMIGMSLAFKVIGSGFINIVKGIASIALMSVGILLFSYSLNSMANSVSKLMNTSGNTWGVDPNDKENSWWQRLLPILGSVAVFGGMMALSAGAFTLLGTLIAPIALGVGAVALLSGGIIAFSFALKQMNESFKGINSKELGNNISENIKSFISGTYEGLRDGLGISGGFSVNGLKSLIKAGGKIALIATGMGVLSAMSVGLSMFAFALNAFKHAGVFDHVEYDKDGNPIVKKSGINIKDVATNISSSLSIFFKTISDLFSDPSKIPDTKKMSEITSVLLGSKAKVLGLSLYSKPGLLDALMYFGDIIHKFGGKNGQFDIYNKGKFSHSVKPSEVINNIMGSISSFFTEMGKIADIYGEKSMQEKLCNIAVLLLGEENFKLQFGGWFKITDKKVGILEPVIKFAEVVKLLSEGYYIDPITKQKQRLVLDGKAVAEKIVSFATTFSEGLKGQTFDVNSIEGFNSFIEVLSEKSDPLERVAKSIDTLASSTERLLAALKSLSQAQLNALFSMANGQASSGGNNSPVYANAPNMIPSTNNSSSVNNVSKGSNNSGVIDKNVADQIALALSKALVGKSFDFKFTNKTGGQLSLS